jgi:hypothetical protein
MRITLTLDDDVAALLTRLRKTRNENLKELVNNALRRGLRGMTTSPEKRPEFKTKSADLGNCLVGNIDNIADTLAIAEDESFR